MDEELEPTNIRGEYVWDGSYLSGADIDVNDRGHEGHFEQEIASIIKDDIIDLANESLEKIKELPEDKLTDDQSYALESIPEMIKKLKSNEDYIDVYEMQNLLDELKNIDPPIYTKFRMSHKNYLEGLKDPRRWGVEQGNIISRHNNFEVWGWNDDVKKNLLSMIFAIEESEEEITPTTEINVHDYASGRTYDFTFDELQSGESGANVVPGAAKTQSNVHIPWNRSMLQGDSTNYKTFGSWIKLRESKSR